MFGRIPDRTEKPKAVRKRDDRCEIVIERQGNKVRKKILGRCSQEQLRALARSGDENIQVEHDGTD